MKPTPVSPSPLRVLIVDDHPVIRRGVGEIIKNIPDLTICGEASCTSIALQQARELHPDVLITDITMPGPNGIELIKSILAEHPHLLILVLSMHEEAEYALRVLRAGAKGYVMKDEVLTALPHALQKILSGEYHLSARLNNTLITQAMLAHDTNHFRTQLNHLSDREMEIFELIGQQNSTRDIARALNLSIKTVETHRAHIKTKLALETADDLCRLATRWVEYSQAAPESAHLTDKPEQMEAPENLSKVYFSGSRFP